ncbi:MAG: sulfatase, partial [Planctomycetales bacterium]|nr:sulfatase [Planctomycetales bacterium]
GSAHGAEAQKPNVVFFLVDDLGYMDIGANNPETFYETPHVDRLAREGVRFTQGYAANPVCSPTRFSLMTGRHPSRVDATNFFSGARAARFQPAPLNDRMALEEATMGEAFREAGYRTAFLGKWHLGPTAEFWPQAQGFEFNVGGHVRGAPRSYFSPYQNPRLEDGPRGEHLTKRLTDEAVRLIDQLHQQPFFLYLSFYTVHTPLQAPADLVRKYREKATRLGLDDKPEFADEEQVWPDAPARRVRILQKHATYAAMVESMDRAVGRVLGKLKELGIDDNTIVCFMSDNGGLSTSEGSPTSNLPLRGGKGWLYEGGIREPFLIKAPGCRAGSTCDTPVFSCDFYPTLLELAGLPARPGQHQDGVSLKRLVAGEAGDASTDALSDRAIFWHYPHYSNQGGFPGGAVRQGDFKLIERFEDGRVHLFNLRDDLSERQDLAKQMPDRVDAMRQRLHAWYRDVDAKFLRAKPDGPQPWQP